jgi:hypothetical protein
VSASDNERIKLSANALNTLATSMITIGVIAPAIALAYGLSDVHRPVWLFALSAVVWVLIGGALHYAARTLLKGIEG